MPNSDRVLSTVDVGFSTIVWTRTLLNVTLDPVVVFLGASYFSSASRDIALTQDNPSDVVALRVPSSELPGTFQIFE